MKFHVLTLFPEMISQIADVSILGKAKENDLIDIQAVNIRDYTTEKHGKVDDYTYGGGAGMLMQAQPVYDAWKAVSGEKPIRTVYVTPQGTPFSQKLAMDFAGEDELIILCGHYEGIDERVLEETVTDYVSIGDYILTGGELAAMVIIDAVARLVPGVLGNETSAETESFHKDLLEYPQYSRPEVWHDKKVPAELLSGNHAIIEKWRLEQSVKRTQIRRPDLYEKYKTREKVIQRLNKQKRKYVHLTETLKRGCGDVLYEDKDAVLVYNTECKLAILTVANEEIGRKMLNFLPDDTVSIEISEAFMIPILEQELGMHVDMQCHNALYTNKEQLPVKYKDIRLLGMEHLDYLCKHYHCAGRDYLTDRIRKGKMYGAFQKEELIGFAGEHEEGSLGLLYVDKNYRRQGVGEALEAYMINKHRQLGFIPYGQVEPDNAGSLKLQDSMKLYLSQEYVWWMSKGPKWSNEEAL